jgi:hypothetical protein
MAALGFMEHLGWEVVAQREAGYFLGHAAAFSAFWQGNHRSEADASVKIWMSPDCYPLRVESQLDDEFVSDWELSAMGADVVCDLPPDMGGSEPRDP